MVPPEIAASSELEPAPSNAKLELTASRQFPIFLAEQGTSPALTTY